ncbi:hypothetical protein NX059_012298 [Plenodomus lindquistii]|nr:hypothetical protein NX059_012298 [Plenodomus lindquistii]
MSPFTAPSTLIRGLAKKYRPLLPPSSRQNRVIYIRTRGARLDLFRNPIIGAAGTPYKYIPFVFDMHISSSYPAALTPVILHSWTRGEGPVNSDLYENGKAHARLRDTWRSDTKSEV